MRERQMSKETLPSKDPGFVRYIMAANATGGGSVNAFLIAMIVFFPLGYYTHYKKVSNRSVQIVHQSTINKKLDEQSSLKINTDAITLRESLAYLGYNKTDIRELLGGEPSRLDKIKTKFTKVIKGKTVYIPKDDCENDYLGEEASEQTNDIIRRGHENRYDSSN